MSPRLGRTTSSSGDNVRDISAASHADEVLSGIPAPCGAPTAVGCCAPGVGVVWFAVFAPPAPLFLFVV